MVSNPTENYDENTTPVPADLLLLTRDSDKKSMRITLLNHLKIDHTDEETFYAKDFLLPTTAPAGALAKAETPTNKVNRQFIPFADGAANNIQFGWWTPSNWDLNAVKIKAQYIWDNPSGLTTEDVYVIIKAVALRDEYPFETAFGSDVTVVDLWTAQLDIAITALSGEITIGGTPALGCNVIFNVERKDADTLTGDARLLAVRILYTKLTVQAT